MSQYIGKDGKSYNSILEMQGANEKFDHLKKQTALLDEQNRLIEEQTWKLEQEARKNRELEEEKMIHESLMQKKQMIHDEEMRILKLFDNVSLNKKFYDEFIDYLFPNNESKISKTLQDNQRKLNKINLDIELIDNYFKGNKTIDEVRHFVVDDEEKDTLISNKNKLNEYLKNHDNNQKIDIVNMLNLEENEEFQNANQKYEEHNKKAEKYSLISMVSLILGFIFQDSMGMLTILLISMFTFSILGIFQFIFAKKTNLLKIIDSSIKEEINIIDEKINNYDSQKYIDEELKNYLFKLNKEKKDIESENNYNEKKLNTVKNKWNDFVTFRKKHYNMQLESLFINAGLEDMITNIGLKYERLNQKNTQKNGAVEDYVTYFNEIKKTTISS